MPSKTQCVSDERKSQREEGERGKAHLLVKLVVASLVEMFGMFEASFAAPIDLMTTRVLVIISFSNELDCLSSCCVEDLRQLKVEREKG